VANPTAPTVGLQHRVSSIEQAMQGDAKPRRRTMTFSKAIVTSFALASSLLSAPVHAEDAARIKPLQGIVFSAADIKGVGYFQSEHGACKLVVTLAEDLGNETTRHEVRVLSGERYLVNANDARFEFGCERTAEVMSFTSLSLIAAVQ
jgi:hypothetical protein